MKMKINIKIKIKNQNQNQNENINQYQNQNENENQNQNQNENELNELNENELNEKEIIKTKFVFIGDENSKKNEFIFELIFGIGKEISKEDDIIKPFGIYQTDFIFEGKEIEIILQNTSDKIDYDGIRHVYYSEADIFLICFSLISPSSFENVKSKFIPEIKQNFPNIPIILIGNELEKRNNPIIIEVLKQNKIKPISYEEGIEIEKENQFIKYLENSLETKKSF
ncbi:hypothetical protein M0811_09487 [Anaeramoeba ignava]|uniref:Uncharacterized protein n=1 Tax=Anaeramoeba ignava TaxID=1746090 RepID=A0A9Q0LFT9_ANAIG|nr:hypothetical protein M0811_09487 [Anaeramoeba ignava]